MTEPDRPAPDPRTRRELLRDRDGSLFDVGEQREVGAEELLEDLKAGRRFRARRRGTGVDCTIEVLVDVVELALSGPLGEGGRFDPSAVLGLLLPRRLGSRAGARAVTERRAARPPRRAGTPVRGNRHG